MAGHDLAHEMALLTVHGVLHLLGYDHIEPKDEREMFALQNEILADWYDDLKRRGVEYQPKPTGAHAFPSAADRDELLAEAEVVSLHVDGRPGNAGIVGAEQFAPVGQ